jgi:RNA polymerase sigma-70 factor (ECF subfamily)
MDERAFAELTERHRHELRVHCYRMLGSFDEAEDLVQETFLRAWRYRTSSADRSSFRAWLYKIATNACLDVIASRNRKVAPYEAAPLVPNDDAPSPPPNVPWLQPFPDHLLDAAAPAAEEPDAIAVRRETIELAFLVSVQTLPPLQRAVLIVRDVLGWPATDTATLLDTSVAAVKSALQRARRTMKEHLPGTRDQWAPTTEPTIGERQIVGRYIDAHENADLDQVAALLAEDVRLTMPPEPAWLVGRDALVSLTANVFDPDSSWYHGAWRCLRTAANRQPAIAHYVEHPTTETTAGLPGRFKGQVLDVLGIADGRVADVTSFDPKYFPAFGLPLTLP